jgi:Lactate dehydrogenase and related dehydrogenases
MVSHKTFAVVGGDLRMAYLAEALAEKSPEDLIYCTSGTCAGTGTAVRLFTDIKLVLPQSNVVIFPLPLLDANGYLNFPESAPPLPFHSCLEYISPDTLVFAGRIPVAVAEQAKRYGIGLIDYMEREEFAVLNAVPTAEGAVGIALQERSRTLFGSNCLVLGNGRIGRCLVKLLIAFGAKVQVGIRKPEDHAWAKIAGATPVYFSDLAQVLQGVDVLFNTVPGMVLGSAQLHCLRRSCLLIDLASRPGGMDFDAAQAQGLRAIHALSLPGKVAPATAGENILDTIWNILKERGFLS